MIFLNKIFYFEFNNNVIYVYVNLYKLCLNLNINKRILHKTWLFNFNVSRVYEHIDNI
ncbi:hypothetical protein KM620_gp082 [Hyposidra talaca nucleopolyhedrovirus]|uniref:Uncharacterized protein n=1 Tax=Hyposidra talaca nucleopolyhedrovirus TaxID=1070315 RepID=A0A2Z4HI44_9ABAC|nr:hypothetical protein KM620_gp082 [Hyposidra talaca nucleopolyhedrovirus]AWW14442.1 hypothetical protein HytaNPV_gp082 [Hyposidra talaca nucleopolyhedrovirus]